MCHQIRTKNRCTDISGTNNTGVDNTKTKKKRKGIRTNITSTIIKETNITIMIEIIITCPNDTDTNNKTETNTMGADINGTNYTNTDNTQTSNIRSEKTGRHNTCTDNTPINNT